MRCKFKRAGVNSLYRVNRVNDVENRQFIGSAGQSHSPAGPPLSHNDIRAAQSLQNFPQISLRDFRRLRNLHGRRRVRCQVRQLHNGSQRVFHGLRNHNIHPKEDLDIQFTPPKLNKVDLKVLFYTKRPRASGQT